MISLYNRIAGRLAGGGERFPPLEESGPGAAPLAVSMDAMLGRLDEGIAAEHAAMDSLLARMASRIRQ